MLKTRKKPEKLVLEGVYIFRKANVHTMYTHVHRFFSSLKGVYILCTSEKPEMYTPATHVK